VALIVEALTDNRNRTAGEVRVAFSKHGGTLGETGSVSFLFERVGAVHYPVAAADAEVMLEAAIEAGADNIDSGEAGHDILCAPDDLGAVREALEARFGPAESARLDWRPRSLVQVSEDDAASLFKLLNSLDDNDDVQHVAANFEVAEDVMARLSA
jgi:YebC/PmpR family DNA-binding regulatory protein